MRFRPPFKEATHPPDEAEDRIGDKLCPPGTLTADLPVGLQIAHGSLIGVPPVFWQLLLVQLPQLHTIDAQWPARYSPRPANDF